MRAFDVEMLEEAARAMQGGLYRAALLIAWAALQAILRRAALRLGAQKKTRVQPSILIRELFAAGYIEPEEHRELEKLRQLRTELAHGLSPRESDRDSIYRIRNLADQLLYRAKL